MKVDLLQYQEAHPHRLKRIVWWWLNTTIYSLLWNSARIALLRMFGARIGRRCLFCRRVTVFAPWNLAVEDAVCIGPGAELYNKAPLSIGTQTVISQDAYLCTAGHDVTSPRMAPISKPIVIGSQCWVGAKAAILPGVELGEGAVIGACAVVAKSVPPWSIAVGNPARVVKKRVLKEA